MLGSWAHQDDKINLTLHQPPFLVQDPTSWNVTNIAWAFGNFSVSKFIFEQPTGNYTRYSFDFKMERSGGTILVAVMIPGSLITLLGLLYILLEKGTGERTSYLSTILLTETMFLVMLTSFVPLSQYVPFMGWLFLAYVILLTLLTISVIFLEKMYQIYVLGVFDDKASVYPTNEEDLKIEKQFKIMV